MKVFIGSVEHHAGRGRGGDVLRDPQELPQGGPRGARGHCGPRLSDTRERLEAERLRAQARAAGLRRDLDAIVEAAALTPPDDEHDPEGTTIGFERALLIDLLSQAEADVESLEKALDRLSTGTYGTCATCGRPVAPERLDAHPTTPICVACAQVRWPRKPT